MLRSAARAALGLTGAETPKPYTPQPLKTQNKKAPDLTIKAPLLEYGVDDGNRTHDNWNHNPALYQLSYAHHIAVLQCCSTALQKHGADEETRTLTACAAGT